MVAVAPEGRDGQHAAVLEVDDRVTPVRDDRAFVRSALELKDGSPRVPLEDRVGGDVRRLQAVLEALQSGIEWRLDEFRSAFRLDGREIRVGRGDELRTRV